MGLSHWFYITPEEYVEAEKIGVKSAMLDRRIREQGWTKERASDGNTTTCPERSPEVAAIGARKRH